MSYLHALSPLVVSLLLATLLAVLPTRPLSAEEGERPLRVMTFNIRFASPGDGDNLWNNRREMVASMIRFHQADVAGLQEVLQGQAKDLEKLLPEYRWIGVGRDDGKQAGEMTPIFYRDDRFELVEQGHFWLSPTPDKAGSQGWDAALPRVSSWAKLRPRDGGQALFVFNTHFDHRGNEARRESARVILRKMKEIAGEQPAILAGDLNCLREHSPYEVLTGASVDEDDGSASESNYSLEDTQTASRTPHHGGNSTFTGFNAPVENLKIDYVLTSPGWRTERHGILTDRWNGRYPSDHFPILVEVTPPSPK